MTPSPDLNNPLLKEIQDAHATLSPAAQEVVKRAMPGVAPSLPGGEAAPKAPAPIAAPAPATNPVTPLVRSHTPSPNEAELSRITAPPKFDTAGKLIHDRSNTGQPGVEQIHNPLVRGLARVGDVVGSLLVPGAMAALPGTTIHHNELVRGRSLQANEESRRGLEEAQGEEAEARAAGEPSQEELRRAQATEAEARAESLRHPVPKDAFELWARQNPNGTPADWAKFQEEHRQVTNDFEKWAKDNPGKPVSEFLALKQQYAIPKEGELPLGDRVDQLNQMMTSRYQVLHPNATLPDQYVIPKNATQKDYERIDKSLEAEEKAIGTREQQAQTNELRKQTLALAQQNREHKDESAVRTASFKAFQPALDSGERFNVMAKNYEDAVKNHDQQAMLSLLANHLGMTMGLQKGARLTKDIITEAKESLPWLQKMEAKFDKNGYLSGVTLAPEQMHQMLTLGRERFTEDVVKARNEAKYMGSTDDGPARTANRSVKMFYMSLAGGDKEKAKQLAQQDGWTE